MFDLSVRVGGINLWTWRAQVVKQSNSLALISHTKTHTHTQVLADAQKILRHDNKNGNRQSCLHCHTLMPINAHWLSWIYTNGKTHIHTLTRRDTQKHTHTHTHTRGCPLWTELLWSVVLFYGAR